jgi:hypothetical protein
MTNAPETIWADPACIDSPSLKLACNTATANPVRALPSDISYTRTDIADARVKAAVEAERERCAELLDNIASDLEADAKRFRGGSDPHHHRMDKCSDARMYAAAIRSDIADARVNAATADNNIMNEDNVRSALKEIAETGVKIGAFVDQTKDLYLMKNVAGNSVSLDPLVIKRLVADLLELREVVQNVCGEDKIDRELLSSADTRICEMLKSLGAKE